MVDSVPLQWKNKGHAHSWVEIDEIVILDIVDDTLNNKWQLRSIVVNLDESLEVRATDGDNLLWRIKDLNTESILRGGLLPAWVIVSVEWIVV